VQTVELTVHNQRVTLTRVVEIETADGEDMDFSCKYTLDPANAEAGFQFQGGEGTIDGEDVKATAMKGICEKLKSGVETFPGFPSEKNEEPDEKDSDDKENDTTKPRDRLRSYKA